MTDDTETPTEGQLERDLIAAARERTDSALTVLLDKVAQRRRTGVRAVQYELLHERRVADMRQASDGHLVELKDTPFNSTARVRDRHWRRAVPRLRASHPGPTPVRGWTEGSIPSRQTGSCATWIPWRSGCGVICGKARAVTNRAPWRSARQTF